MKLYLASSIDKTISGLKLKAPELGANSKVFFITNAADTYTNTWWIDLDRKTFENLGWEIIDTDLRKISKDEFKNQLENADIVHVCGGSVLYLITLLKEKGLDKILAENISQSKIIYTGTSAGSMIVAKDLKLSAYDEEEAKFVANIKDFTGLGLVDFYIIPHCQNAEFVATTLKMIEHLPEIKYPIFLINDNQAIWVDDKKFEIISV
ncbi:MAG: Type 1 glutamine amidotransferase-like domain-containing protein [Patescibacteria group bacterium]